MTWTSFWTILHGYPSSVPHYTRRAMHSTGRPCLLDACRYFCDPMFWPIPVDVFRPLKVPQSRSAEELGISVAGTRASTSFWTMSHAFLSPCDTLHAPCAVLYSVAMRMAC